MNRVIRLFPRLAVCGALFSGSHFGATSANAADKDFVSRIAEIDGSNCITRRVVTALR